MPDRNLPLRLLEVYITFASVADMVSADQIICTWRILYRSACTRRPLRGDDRGLLDIYSALSLSYVVQEECFSVPRREDTYLIGRHCCSNINLESRSKIFPDDLMIIRGPRGESERPLDHVSDQVLAEIYFRHQTSCAHGQVSKSILKSLNGNR